MLLGLKVVNFLEIIWSHELGISMRGSAFGVGDHAGRFSGKVVDVSGQGGASPSCDVPRECLVIVQSDPTRHPCVCPGETRI